MEQKKIVKKDQAKPKPKPELDLRTPSGKQLPY
jgi:hypothetical protein